MNTKAGIAIGVVVALIVMAGSTLWPRGLDYSLFARSALLDPIFYPGGWLDAASNGVPDFDQKQGPWFDRDVNWSWDGPVAAANAL